MKNIIHFPLSGRLRSAVGGGFVGACVGGFTLLELMAVVAIIAILGAMALPTYQARIIRQQIDEALVLAETAKGPVALSWASKQSFPSDNLSAGLPSADKMVNNFVSSIAVQDGVINITFGNSAASTIKGKILSLRPAVVPEAPIVPVAWVCGKGDVPGKMTVQGSDRTSLQLEFLPRLCRGTGVAAS